MCVETFICDLSESQIEAMTKATTLLITTVGPFLRYGTPVVEACVRNGTHYVDSTGEYPWVRQMVQRFHDQAKEKGIIVGSPKETTFTEKKRAKNLDFRTPDC